MTWPTKTEIGSKDGSGVSSTLLAYGGGGRGNKQPAAPVSVSLEPAKAKDFVSASAKAAAEGPEDASASDSAEVLGTVNSGGPAEPDA